MGHGKVVGDSPVGMAVKSEWHSLMLEQPCHLHARECRSRDGFVGSY